MTIVLAPHSPGLSHVGRTLLVAEPLRRMGHRCVFVGEGPLLEPEDSMVRRKGFEVRPLIDLSMEEVVKAKNFDYHNPESLRRLVAAEREMIAELKPSVIVTSYRPSLHLAAAIERIPVVSITNTHYTHFWGTPISPPLEHPITLRVTGLLGQRLGMAVLKHVAPRIAAHVLKRTVGIYNDMLAEYGLPPYRDMLHLWEGSARTYLADAPEWCATKHPLPAGVEAAGPLYWTAEAETEWADTLPADRPVVYLSAGSSGNPEIFPALYRELGGLPCQFVMTTAGLAVPPGAPENFMLYDFLPGDAVMRRSAFAILNGGSGTIYQAIDTRTPMLLMPMRADQEWNAKDAIAMGIARAVHCRHVIDQPGRLRQAAEAMLASGDAMRARLEVLAPQLARYQAAETVAAGVDALARSGAPTHA